MAAEQKLFLISKLTCTTVLFYPPKVGTKQRIYGDRVDFAQLKDHKIDEKEEDDCIFTFFQIKKVRTRNIGQFINVVIIRCYHSLLSFAVIIRCYHSLLSFAVIIKKAKNQDSFCYFRPI